MRKKTIYACFKNKYFYILTSDEHKFIIRNFKQKGDEVFSYKLSEEQCCLLFNNRGAINTDYNWWKKNGKKVH